MILLNRRNVGSKNVQGHQLCGVGRWGELADTTTLHKSCDSGHGLKRIKRQEMFLFLWLCSAQPITCVT